MPTVLRKVGLLWIIKVLKASMTEGLNQEFFCQFEILMMQKESHSARNGVLVESDAANSIK